MYLKSLTARGFKSFADRITLDFEPGISVIVGPNGSGKSNIADAVLWVLGEQSPRNLRGTKMEDVIFAGSASRQPLSVAEVSLSFDNRGGKIPLAFPEVVVTRRIYRSGESEYLLNKAPCRLVDIQELLSDLGVGRELTAVIGQNKLEAILRSQPEDRRAFLEEAAGLRKHRRRKEKALRKMEGMERNLVRVRDIISEVSKQLRPLERQAKQAREYGEISAEIRDLSIRLLLAELGELKGQWENRRGEEERLARELEEASREVREGKERTAALEARLRELRLSLDRSREQEMRLLSLGERLRSCQSLGEERLKLYAALGGDIAYREGWRSRRELLLRRRGELEGELEEARRELEAAKAEEGRLLGEGQDLNRCLNRARHERDALRKALAQVAERERELMRGAEGAAAGAAEALAEAAELIPQREAARERLAELEAETERKARSAGELAKRRAGVEERMAEERAALARMREELECIARRQRKYFQEEALVVARLRALEELFASRIDYAAAAGRVMEESAGLTGVLGMLLHKVSVAEEWEKALESFLGPWLFGVVTRDLASALEAVRLLKQGEEGYGIFLPLAEMAEEGVEETLRLAREAGGIAALDVVDCDDEVRPALACLLGDVVLCKTLEEAGSKAERYPRLTFVTEDGDVVAPERAVKGGARPRSPFHLIARRREIEQLQEMLDLCDEEGISLEVQRKSFLSSIAGLEKSLEQLAEEERSLAAELKELEVARRETEMLMASTRGVAAELSERIRALQEKADALEREAASLKSEAAGEGGRRGELEPRLAAAEKAVEELRRREREREEKLQGVTACAASLDERQQHLEERIAELDAELEGPPPPGREELAGLVGAQEELLELVGVLVQAHGRLAARMASGEAEKRGELERLEAESEEMRRRVEEAEAREGRLRELVHNRDLAAAQLQMRVDMLVQRLLDEFKLPLETALADYTPAQPADDMRERLQGLERRRDMLGQVNLHAVEEYRAMKERYEFLMGQVEDLRESKASLLKVVRAIDREIIRIFKETFDEVNRHFQELFEMLFPQGRAELSLTDPTDLLNTGVDIEAQPRGKRLKKLSLLSGGETALISLAFLFAIFKTRPSPFYFLDEVEAALDDVNLHRFLNMLKEFKRDSQLIVITHQKRTMEIADILYGVSMQASGVSRVVSQRLEEAERLARTGT